MTTSKWTMDSNHSDVLIKSKHNTVAYLANAANTFSGSIAVKDDQLEDASIEFLVDTNSKKTMLETCDINLKSGDYLDSNKYPSIQFKSISFEKINSNINFLKGFLTINNITKTVELEAVLLDIETKNGVSKALFEVVGTINRKEYGLSSLAFIKAGDIGAGQKIKLAANLEFYSKN